ncbi:AsmA-like C-terminal domain-containing protein [Campylobacter molothri]|uniref:YhdP family protein n=1 Tax=Campylobacter molothri TaxID=1032242 RepID=UPI00301DA8D3|nr:AsmA-like C-terminal domain-containing protein [Campylobacter sp. RM10534]
MKKKILYILVILFVLFSVMFLVLKNGIFISSIQFDFLKIQQLYIKLDKKLIFRAKNIALNFNDTSENNSNFDSKTLLKMMKNLKYLYNFVEEVNIGNLYFKNQKLKILFKDGDYFIDSNDLFLKASFTVNNGNLSGTINSLKLKKYNLNLNGFFEIKIKSNFYNLNLNANSDNLTFKSTISYKDNKLLYQISDLNATNIQNIATIIRRDFVLNETLDQWIFKNVVGEFYHLDFLQGFIDFKQNNYYFDNISASGYIDKVKVRLENNMDAIEIPRVDLNLSQQKLDLQFNKASYDGADLSQSKVYLYDIFNEEKAGIYLRIKSDNLKLDEKLEKALQNYHLNLPFYQKSGTIKADLELKIDFHEKGQFLHNGIFYLNSANISLADMNISKGLIKLTQDDLSIENADIENRYLKANINAKINLKEKQGIFNIQLYKLHFDDDLLDIENQNITLNLDLNQDLLTIPEWNLIANFKNGLEFNLNNPNILFSYSKILKDFGFNGAGSVYFKSLDFKDFDLQAQDVSFNHNLFINNQTPYNKDSFSIVRKNDIIYINTQSDLISATISSLKKEIQVKNLTYIYKKQKNSPNSFDISTNKQNIIFGGANCALILADMNKTLAFDKLEINLDKNILNVQGSRGNTNLNFYYSPDDLKFFVKNINDQYLNEFLQKQAVQDGIFNLSIVGSGLEYFDGEFDFKNTFVKDLKGVNQLISFIDTVPSLLMFKTPTFNQKGLKFQNGKVIFNRKKDLLSFSAINLNGDSVDIYGLGSANLRLDTIDLNLELKTLKSASETISKVPILNYVILGKNQEISTNIKVDGKIDNPNFHTQILTDTLKTPFNLIKNIIQLPKNLFD